MSLVNNTSVLIPSGHVVDGYSSERAQFTVQNLIRSFNPSLLRHVEVVEPTPPFPVGRECCVWCECGVCEGEVCGVCGCVSRVRYDQCCHDGCIQGESGCTNCLVFHK